MKDDIEEPGKVDPRDLIVRLNVFRDRVLEKAKTLEVDHFVNDMINRRINDIIHYEKQRRKCIRNGK